MNTVTRLENEEICDGVIAFREWLRSHSVPVDRSRLSELIDATSYLRPCVAARARLEALPIEERDQLVQCFFDAYSLVLIHRSMLKLKHNQLPQQALKEAIQAPVDPAREVAGTRTVNARNHMYELELAGRLIAGGQSVIGFDDVLLQTRSGNVCIQCKRIEHIKNLRSAFDHAVQQIQKRIPEKASYGVVAICLDRVVQMTTRVFEVEKGEELSAVAREFLFKYHKLVRDRLREQLDQRLLGARIDLKCLGFSRSTGQFVIARETGCASLDSSTMLLEPERRLFREIMGM